MGPFPQSFGNLYILMVVDFVFKWIEVVATPSNDAKVVTTFLIKNIFSRHVALRGIIIGEGIHFFNNCFEDLIAKYWVKHKVSTTRHP